ncbi:uncharacterized protein PHALS_09731 [Plasmopara halstedii]|uniref:Uncharacterized protein n=1 Tax=Plasmopara halstedii TaxID=4781 RepID=A0A0P1AEK0_PLAHL|nr:uncharacterized protein PHALS_09731 [Plasmopara halstedii]CEG39487.1 hypothetical protein PHALS_09731 [Plasmopara halstedii]|eukprot:XP_024575856.1 hypothetical protein PHALS_09731 [Plasmopara halstedii]
MVSRTRISFLNCFFTARVVRSAFVSSGEDNTTSHRETHVGLRLAIIAMDLTQWAKLADLQAQTVTIDCITSYLRSHALRITTLYKETFKRTFCSLTEYMVLSNAAFWSGEKRPVAKYV